MLSASSPDAWGFSSAFFLAFLTAFIGAISIFAYTFAAGFKYVVGRKQCGRRPDAKGRHDPLPPGRCRSRPGPPLGCKAPFRGRARIHIGAQDRPARQVLPPRRADSVED